MEVATFKPLFERSFGHFATSATKFAQNVSQKHKFQENLKNQIRVFSAKSLRIGSYSTDHRV
jgi:hypothetical protein